MLQYNFCIVTNSTREQYCEQYREQYCEQYVGRSTVNSNFEFFFLKNQIK